MEIPYGLHASSWSANAWVRGLRGIALAATFTMGGAAHALLITPNFDISITGSTNASGIESAITSAISTVDSLYSNAVSLTVNFSYNTASSGNLLTTTQYYYGYSYGAYTTALANDAAANPGNTTLATALANLGSGNDASGTKQMALSYGQALMLSSYGLAGPTLIANAAVNINSLQNFNQLSGSGGYDLIGGLEHELNEVLGGGGAGSTLNNLSSTFFGNKYSALDLYRYSAPDTPSFSTTASSSYFSVDGGVTNIVNFNQSPGGDYGDFGPSCGTGGGSGQLIQNAFNCTGPYEAYTTASPEFTMMQSIGWNAAQSSSNVPEPATLALLGIGLMGLGAAGRRHRASV